MNVRTPTRVHTRKLDRSVARASMKRERGWYKLIKL